MGFPILRTQYIFGGYYVIFHLFRIYIIFEVRFVVTDAWKEAVGRIKSAVQAVRDKDGDRDHP
jgi:hypothetical protein